LWHSLLGMGVNHGGNGGDSSPPEFGVRDANANCPHPDFVMFQNVKDQIACIYHAEKCSTYTLAVMAISYPVPAKPLE